MSEKNIFSPVRFGILNKTQNKRTIALFNKPIKFAVKETENGTEFEAVYKQNNSYKNIKIIDVSFF